MSNPSLFFKWRRK